MSTEDRSKRYLDGVTGIIDDIARATHADLRDASKRKKVTDSQELCVEEIFSWFSDEFLDALVNYVPDMIEVYDRFRKPTEDGSKLSMADCVRRSIISSTKGGSSPTHALTCFTSHGRDLMVKAGFEGKIRGIITHEQWDFFIENKIPIIPTTDVFNPNATVTVCESRAEWWSMCSPRYMFASHVKIIYAGLRWIGGLHPESYYKDVGNIKLFEGRGGGYLIRALLIMAFEWLSSNATNQASKKAGIGSMSSYFRAWLSRDVRFRLPSELYELRYGRSVWALKPIELGIDIEEEGDVFSLNDRAYEDFISHQMNIMTEDIVLGKVFSTMPTPLLPFIERSDGSIILTPSCRTTACIQLIHTSVCASFEHSSYHSAMGDEEITGISDLIYGIVRSLAVKPGQMSKTIGGDAVHNFTRCLMASPRYVHNLPLDIPKIPMDLDSVKMNKSKVLVGDYAMRGCIEYSLFGTFEKVQDFDVLAAKSISLLDDSIAQYMKEPLENIWRHYGHSDSDTQNPTFYRLLSFMISPVGHMEGYVKSSNMSALTDGYASETMRVKEGTLTLDESPLAQDGIMRELAGLMIDYYHANPPGPDVLRRAVTDSAKATSGGNTSFKLKVSTDRMETLGIDLLHQKKVSLNSNLKSAVLPLASPYLLSTKSSGKIDDLMMHLIDSYATVDNPANLAWRDVAGGRTRRIVFIDEGSHFLVMRVMRDAYKAAFSVLESNTAIKTVFSVHESEGAIVPDILILLSSTCVESNKPYRSSTYVHASRDATKYDQHRGWKVRRELLNALREYRSSNGSDGLTTERPNLMVAGKVIENPLHFERPLLDYLIRAYERYGTGDVGRNQRSYYAFSKGGRVIGMEYDATPSGTPITDVDNSLGNYCSTEYVANASGHNDKIRMIMGDDLLVYTDTSAARNSDGVTRCTLPEKELFVEKLYIDGTSQKVDTVVGAYYGHNLAHYLWRAVYHGVYFTRRVALGHERPTGKSISDCASIMAKISMACNRGGNMQTGTMWSCIVMSLMSSDSVKGYSIRYTAADMIAPGGVVSMWPIGVPLPSSGPSLSMYSKRIGLPTKASPRISQIDKAIIGSTLLQSGDKPLLQLARGVLSNSDKHDTVSDITDRSQRYYMSDERRLIYQKELSSSVGLIDDFLLYGNALTNTVHIALGGFVAKGEYKKNLALAALRRSGFLSKDGVDFVRKDVPRDFSVRIPYEGTFMKLSIDQEFPLILLKGLDGFTLYNASNHLVIAKFARKYSPNVTAAPPERLITEFFGSSALRRRSGLTDALAVFSPSHFRTDIDSKRVAEVLLRTKVSERFSAALLMGFNANEIGKMLPAVQHLPILFAIEEVSDLVKGGDPISCLSFTGILEFIKLYTPSDNKEGLNAVMQLDKTIGEMICKLYSAIMYDDINLRATFREEMLIDGEPHVVVSHIPSLNLRRFDR